MPLADYAEQGILNYLNGSLILPTANAGLTPPASFLALFTAAPPDAGGGTEVTSAGGTLYARVQVGGSATVNGTTASGNPTLHFAATPAWIVAGMSVRDATAPAVIPGATTVLSTTGTTVVMSANAAGAGVGATDVITFSAFAPATASVGAEPATVPGSTVNTNAIITFPQAAAAGWGTVTSWALFDALSGGNMVLWDYLGNFAWRPFTCTLASPGVLTSTAHGYANADPVVVTAKYGGTLPATGGSWTGALTVAGVTTDTFTAGVNTTGTGNGAVRKIVQQSIPANVTASFATSQFTITLA